jgi:hypothetical protein
VSPHAPVIAYVIVWVPAPAVVGSNIPDVGFVIPDPLQTPPPSAATSCTELSFAQKGPALEITALNEDVTVTVADAEPEQMPLVPVTVYVVVVVGDTV